MNVRNAMITAIITTGLVSSAVYADDINTVVDASAIAGKSSTSYQAPKTNIQTVIEAAGYSKLESSNEVVAGPRSNIQSNIEANRNS